MSDVNLMSSVLPDMKGKAYISTVLRGTEPALVTQALTS